MKKNFNTGIMFAIVNSKGRILEKSRSYQKLFINLDGWNGNCKIKIING